MKPLADAIGELLAVYGPDVECQVCHGVGVHADDCAWLSLAAWHRDVNAMLDGIRQKAGLTPEAKPDTTLPAEIRERA